MSDSRISTVILTIEEMERAKRNYSRRMNYKINKLRDLSAALAKGEDPDSIPEESWEASFSETHSTPSNTVIEPDQQVADEVAEEEPKPEVKSNPEHPPIDYSKTFELERDDNLRLEIWDGNKWVPAIFMVIQKNDKIRLVDRNSGDPKAIDGVNYFDVVSDVYKSEKSWVHTVKVAYGYIPKED